MSKNWDVIVVGSGPAGLTAALYASRYGLTTLCVEGYASLGQLQTTTDVENYPGFRNGIMGPDLMQEMRAQAERFGVEYITKDATAVNLQEKVVTVESDTYKCRAIIIATGAKAKLLGLDREDKLMGKGLSTCATCDGFFFRDQDIVVVGGGDSAMEESLVLSKFAKNLHLVHRRDSFRASQAMQNKVLQLKNITIHYDSAIEAYLGEKEIEGIRLKNLKTDKTKELSAQGVFIAIGHTPNTQLFKDSLDVNELDYLVTSPDSTRTKLPGVFACGDVQDHVYRQAVTAAGSGCMAAIDAFHHLSQ